MSKYILSTMVHDVAYTFYNQNKDYPAEVGKVLLRGGASIPSETSGLGEMSRDLSGKPIWTAQGVVTTVSDSDYEKLKDHKVFKDHLAGGLVKVINHDITGSNREIEKHAMAMGSDPFAQLTPSTLKQRVKVKTGTPETEDDFRL